MFKCIITPVNNLGARFKQALIESGLGYNELDRALGKTTAYSSRLAAGHRTRPDPASLSKISEILNVSLSWLVDGVGPKSRTNLVVQSDRLPKELVHIAEKLGYSADEVVTAFALVRSDGSIEFTESLAARLLEHARQAVSSALRDVELDRLRLTTVPVRPISRRDDEIGRPRRSAYRDKTVK